MTDRRKALGLGLAASALALSGRGTARAADALTIDAGGVKIDKLEVAGPLKITGANMLEFGANVPDKQVDAGKIGYGVWGKNDSLDIVGAGTKTGNGEDRKITFFAEGGAILKGWDSHPDLEVAGGQERLRMLRGIVDIDGNKTAGVGFDVKKQDGTSGTYQITFNPAFSSTPAASANQLALAESAYTTDSALIMEVSPGRMRVKTGARYGDETPRAFTFIVIGPR